MKAKRLRLRTRLLIWFASSLSLGIGLGILSYTVRPAVTRAVASAPASPARLPPQSAAAQSLSNMLLLFSLMGLGVSVVCASWVVIDIRNARPAWKTQTRYPLHR